MKKYILPILTLAVSALSFTACNKADKFQYGKEIVLVTGTDYSPIVAGARILADQVPISYSFSVSATGAASEDIQAHIMYDLEALAAYNKEKGTSYTAVPREVLLINDEYVTIPKGAAVSDYTSVTMLDNSFIEEGVNYVIPLSIAYIQGGNAQLQEGSRSFFIKVAKTMETYSLDINSTAPYSTFSFGNNAYDLNNWTLEIKAFPYNMKSRGSDQLCRLACWNEDGGGQVLLRFNENGKPWKTLDIVAPSGRYVTASTGEGDSAVGTFEPNAWYMISMVWDGSNLNVYINGQKDTPTQNTISGSQAFKLNRFEIGMSWGGYGSSQSYTGRMAEMRIWNIARSQSDIASSLCSVDAKSEGLLGYWKMNEGQGHVFYDSAGDNDMDWSKSERQKDETNYVTTPEAGDAVSWVKDDKNKCAQ